MKRILLLALALALMLPAAAPAEPEWLASPVQIDLDGDGAAETVRFGIAEDGCDGHLQLAVSGTAGEAVYDTPILCGEGVCAADLDGDGGAELFATGDVMSDDYCTYCLRWEGGRLTALPFADAGRGENDGSYSDEGYGRLTDLDADRGTVTLCGSQDVLGTWFGSRTLMLEEDGRFGFADGGMWVRDLPAADGGDLWDSYAALTAKAPVPCELGGAPSMLEPGTQLLITASDKRENAEFITRDGRAGRLSIRPDEARGWGWLVDGIPEDELFETVPYAD